MRRAAKPESGAAVGVIDFKGISASRSQKLLLLLPPLLPPSLTLIPKNVVTQALSLATTAASNHSSPTLSACSTVSREMASAHFCLPDLTGGT